VSDGADVPARLVPGTCLTGVDGVAVAIPNRSQGWTLTVDSGAGAFSDLAQATAYAAAVEVVDDPQHFSDWYPGPP
jgi:hypothetical protein